MTMENKMNENINNGIEFIDLPGKINDNIKTLFTDVQSSNKDLIELQTKANTIIKNYYLDKATASICRFLYTKLIPIFREIKILEVTNDIDIQRKKLLIKQAKHIINVLTAAEYKDKTFVSDEEILNEIELYYQEIKDNKPLQYLIKRGIAISNGIRRYISINNKKFDYLPIMIDVLYGFEQIVNSLLNKKEIPNILPLYGYNKDMKDVLPAVDVPETVEPDPIEPATEVEASNDNPTALDPEPSELNYNTEEVEDKPLEPKLEEDDEDYTIEKKIKKNSLLYDISDDIKNYKKK